MILLADVNLAGVELQIMLDHPAVEDVIYVPEIMAESAPDFVIIDEALRHGYVIVTRDRGFNQDLQAVWQVDHPSVLIIRHQTLRRVGRQFSDALHICRKHYDNGVMFIATLRRGKLKIQTRERRSQ